ncbi:MAG: DUF3772 domain-containing protein [Pseudomonadota bacterium]
MAPLFLLAALFALLSLSDPALADPPGPPGEATEQSPVAADTGGAGTTDETAPAPDVPVSPLVTEQQAVLDGLRAELSQTEAALLRDTITDESLNAVRSEAESIRRRAEAAAAAVTPDLTRMRERLAELGTPEDGAPPESAQIMAERAQLTAQLEPFDAIAQRANLLVVESNQILERVTVIRRERLTRELTERGDGLTAPGLWVEMFESQARIFSSMQRVLSDAYTYVAARASIATLWPIAAVILVAAIFGRIISRLLRRMTGRFKRDKDFSPGRRALFGLAVLVRQFVVPALAIILSLAVVISVSLLPERIVPLTAAFAGAVCVFLLLRAISIVYLAPFQPELRLAPIEDLPALRLHSILTLIAIVFAAGPVWAAFGELVFAPGVYSTVTIGVSAVLIAILQLGALREVTVARRALDGEDEDFQFTFLPWPVIRFTLWIAIATVLFAALTGYVTLSGFVARQSVVIIAVLGLLVLFLRVADKVITGNTEPGGRFNGFAQREMGLSVSATHQLGVLANGVFRLFAIILAAILVLSPFGLRAEDWLEASRQLVSGFTIGDVRIEPFAVIGGIIAFAVGLVIVRAIRRWFETVYLPSTSLDGGVRNSIATAISYAGIILAAGFAISIVGFDLSRFAIIAGALSVGIGFGLQSIVNNFVSGLILLAERPVKVGDWIVVGAEQGTVKKISVRATEIQTFDRASVILPNSDLITGQVKNWTHSNTLGRFVIGIGVSYDSDPEQVRDILLEIVRGHSGVLAFPEPAVYFMEFGASSLDFAVYGFLADIGNTLVVQSEIRFEIMKRFRDADIEIPFPQQDLHVRSVDPAVASSFAGANPSVTAKTE